MQARSLLFLPVFAFFLHACGGTAIQGRPPVKSETRPPSGAFTAIDISGQLNADITVGGSPAIMLEGYGNLLPYYETKVEGSTLKISPKPGTSLRTDKGIKATITLPALTGLRLSGAGEVTVHGMITAEEFRLDVSGAAKIDLQQVAIQEMTVGIDGAARLSIGSGDIRTGSYALSGAGKLLAGGTTQQDVSLHLSGAGEARVHATGSLDAEVSGAGTVRYSGNPKVTKNVSGAGTVEAVE